MSYYDGFVCAVPIADKDKFVEYARRTDAMFVEHGALRVVECWGDDVPRGRQTDFYGAVAAKEDETVVLSWIEWPDKATRDAMYARMDELTRTDPRWDLARNPMPFDARRMIYGGFDPVVTIGA